MSRPARRETAPRRRSTAGWPRSPPDPIGDRRMKKTAFLALAGLALAGCTTTHADGTTSTNKTAVGATLGAITGGILGNRASGDHRARNTVIGAAAGAAVGGGIGYVM